MDFVKVNGKKFYYKDKPIRFSGLGIGSWLNLEHFMLGIPTTEKQIKEAFEECFGKEKCNCFFRNFVMSFIREEDFQFLKRVGINLIRVPFNYHWFLDDECPEVWREE